MSCPPPPRLTISTRRGNDEWFTTGERHLLEQTDMMLQDVLNGLAEVLHQMKAICHLNRIRSTPCRAHRILFSPVTTDHHNARMLLEPGSEPVRRTVRQEVHHTVSLKIDEQRAVAMAFAPGPIIDPTDGYGEFDRFRRVSDQAQQRVRAGAKPELPCQASTGFALGGEANGFECFRKSVCATSRDGRHGVEPLGKDALLAS